MTTSGPHLKISAPGRVCLFGEHQDYLNLPVVPCAISMRISMEGTVRQDRFVHIDLPDIGSEESFFLGKPLPYGAKRDYFRSSVNVLLRKGFSFSRGCDCTVRGEIPINSGTSSSSALVVTWIQFLAQISDQYLTLPPMETARLAHEAEVLEFREPGGMMDHFSTACGGVLAIDFQPVLSVQTIPVELGTFVLGDSEQPKDTTAILSRVKDGVVQASRTMMDRYPGFSLQTATPDAIEKAVSVLTNSQRELLLGTLRNRDISRQARQLMGRNPIDHQGLGELLLEHQAVLREVLRISTAKIDAMIEAAIQAGAYGAKINGSGGGGCMFAYCPENPELVAEAIRRKGGKAMIVQADAGVRTEFHEVED